MVVESESSALSSLSSSESSNISLSTAFKNVPVLITGHTGFKGSWLSLWLKHLGANVIGYSLPSPTSPNNFDVSSVKDQVISIEADIRDVDQLCDTIKSFQPKIVFHLAAQAIVGTSYKDPLGTISANAFGTSCVLDAVRRNKCVKAGVFITTDKVYENQELIWGYRESDRLGGHDPYSASKGMAELAIASYRKSFFPVDKWADHGVSIASTRAGNVIGGGDFADLRIVPDCMRSLMRNESIPVRNPKSVRPFQFVLEPLRGYLSLAEKLLHGSKCADAYNFGPRENKGVRVIDMVEKSIQFWGSGEYSVGKTEPFKETAMLRLNWDKALHDLNWEPVLSWDEGLKFTVDWYKEYHRQVLADQLDMRAFCLKQINEYEEICKQKGQ